MKTDFYLEIIHKETITPSSPTPPHLKTLHLSFLDQYFPNVYIPLLLIYPNHDDNLAKSTLLKSSLSETLTHFYPFAGKFQHNDSIHCDDRGALFVEARVKCRISRILKEPDIDMLKSLFPNVVESNQALRDPLLLVQVNLFECGGVAIAINLSHKVADAFTLSNFMKSWSTIALIGSITLPIEFGVASSLYPPQDHMNSPKTQVEFGQGKCTSRRFVFDATRIAALKTKAASVSVPNPTRVEAVSALIWKCAMEASRANSGAGRPSLWCQVVNIRKILGQDLMGNLVWYFGAVTTSSVADLQRLVATFRKCNEDFKTKYYNGISKEDAYEAVKESGNILVKDDMEIYACSSWCRFPFYETDFGFGKPSWVSVVSSQNRNIVVLVDARDGDGVEASLALLEEEMAIVESNQELLAYASLNPSVI